MTRCYHLPVAHPKHTEVLGYRVSTKAGKALWDTLDWSNWWIDGPSPHMFNPGGMYFHVACHPDSEAGRDECVYRVRCYYAGGTYKGRRVTSIGIAMRDGQLHWIVRCGPEETPA